MKVSGKITGKELNEGDTWKRAVFVINERKYSTFEEDYIKQFNTGDNVELEYETTTSKDGKYKYNNIISMKKIDFVTANNYDKDFYKEKEIKIARMNALTNAVNLLNLIPTKVANENELMVLVKDIAEQLVEYIYFGKKKDDNKFPDY